MAENEYFAKTTRTSLAFIKEVGAMPFLLFQYYQTWATAPDGIKPSLKTVCDDLGLTKSAVCNLKKILIQKGWIREESGEIFLLKSFRKNERRSEILNDRSEKMNESFRKNERPIYKDEKEKIEGKREEYLSPRETPKTSVGNRNGILAADVLESEAKDIHFRLIVDGMKERLGTPGGLPKEFEWVAAVNFAWINNFSAERFFQTFDLLERIRKKKLGQWRITAGMIENNIADTERLEIELRNLENGTDANQKQRANNNGGHGKQDSVELADDLRRLARKPANL